MKASLRERARKAETSVCTRTPWRARRARHAAFRYWAVSSDPLEFIETHLLNTKCNFKVETERTAELLCCWSRATRATHGDISLLLFKWNTELAFIRAKYTAKCILERAVFCKEKQDNEDIGHHNRRDLAVRGDAVQGRRHDKRAASTCSCSTTWCRC